MTQNRGTYGYKWASWFCIYRLIGWRAFFAFNLVAGKKLNMLFSQTLLPACLFVLFGAYWTLCSRHALLLVHDCTACCFTPPRAFEHMVAFCLSFRVNHYLFFLLRPFLNVTFSLKSFPGPSCLPFFPLCSHGLCLSECSRHRTLIIICTLVAQHLAFGESNRMYSVLATLLSLPELFEPGVDTWHKVGSPQAPQPPWHSLLLRRIPPFGNGPLGTENWPHSPHSEFALRLKKGCLS